MKKETIKRMNCHNCDRNHDQYATKEMWGQQIRCSCGFISTVVLQFGDDGTGKDYDGIPEIFTLVPEHKNYDNAIVNSLVEAFKKGFILTDGHGMVIDQIDDILDIE